MKKVWMHISRSFKEADEFDRQYYLKMTPQERLYIMQELREIYYSFVKPFKGEKRRHGHRKGLQRVIRIVQQA